jgi:hypothetical protein
MLVTAKLPARATSLQDPDPAQDNKKERGRKQVQSDSARSGRVSEDYDENAHGKDRAAKGIRQ